MNDKLISLLRQRAYNLRALSLEMTTAAGSGHPTSALSAADLVAALFFYAMKFNPDNPDDPTNDRFILSKGHGVPVLYAAWEQVGVLSKEDLLTLRSFNSVLEGHPTPRFAYCEVATGSLGCGLSNGLGMALAGRLSGKSFYTYVLLGDSEMTEGSVWEAIEVAAFYKVDTLVALVDLNGLGQSTETLDDHDLEMHAVRWRAFGWYAICIDGHDIPSIVAALDEAKTVREKPTVIIARTMKGSGLERIENKEGFHGKAFSKEELPLLLKELENRFGKDAHTTFESLPRKPFERKKEEPIQLTLPKSTYKKGDLVPTRKAFGETLTVLGSFVQNIVSLDAEVKNSTFAEVFEKKFPHRFFQCFVAEQNMIGMAVGFATRGFIPFCSTFASFLTRAYDQIRMGAISRVPFCIAGTHAGVSIGQDGPSQMGLEDMALMRAVPDSIVLYPCDAVSTYALMVLMVQYREGISYLRLTRAATPVIYEPNELFFVGGCKILRESDDDRACIIAAGITVFEALKCYEQLKEQNIMVSVIDLYSVKPLDEEELRKQALKAGGRVITVEDHNLQGGLGEAVCYALRNDNVQIEVLAVKMLSRSGKLEELLAYHAIDQRALVEAVYRLLG